MQIITIAGNVGKDPVLRRTQGGDPILGFSVAVSNGRDTKPTWYDVSVFGKQAMSLDPLIGKGTSLTVNGRFSTREHDGKTYLQVSATEVKLQGSRNEGQQSSQKENQAQQSGQSYAQQSGGYGGMDDDLPF
ncbi:single-stranded DNA-binding protein [Bacillus subtilis]|uniref:single-stranded DNA-binding protein n=1 Tax=Pseudochrobactrum asaccharolyticum TaxID=354351 RepID=UPI001F492872|nr:single-stranded DNA-binding protein [Pseudochrobactrum asaccharolyticum]MCF7647279.1 single-stranded DNA-binding protein [Pseudochrobactrum asaccharolyticum]MCF7673570.1 single-stranded DNA-binding protein [Bacillus subtilis]